MLIAFANSKGGVGKTTISVHYAVAQAEKGRKIALIDSDAQGSSTRWLRDIEDAITIIPLKTADDVIDQMPKIVSQFDIVVADGPAGLSEVTRALLLVTDLALLPCGPSALDLRAAQDAIRVVQQAQMIRKGPPKTFLLPNKVQTNYQPQPELLVERTEVSPCSFEMEDKSNTFVIVSCAIRCRPLPFIRPCLIIPGPCAALAAMLSYKM